VADRALSRAEKLPTLAETSLTWSPRVPATWHEAQAVLAQADPQTMAPLTAGSRSHGVPSSYGGVAPRWGLISSAPRPPPAQRTVDTQGRTQRDQAGTAFQPRGRTAFACAAEAQQALTRFASGLQPPGLYASPGCPPPHSGKRGRPSPGTQPNQIVSQMTGARASRRTDRRARIDQQRGCILATHALDEGQ
jgi:hypothetical protein